jgi:hypothetical protein
VQVSGNGLDYGALGRGMATGRLDKLWKMKLSVSASNLANPLVNQLYRNNITHDTGSNYAKNGKLYQMIRA